MVYVAAVLGVLCGCLLGFVARMIQSAIYDASHSRYAGTLNVVKFEGDRSELLLDLDDSPDNLKDGDMVIFTVRVTRR